MHLATTTTEVGQSKAAEDSRTAMSCVKPFISFPFFIIVFVFLVLTFPTGGRV